MNKKSTFTAYKEFIYQLVFLSILFLFFAFDKHDPRLAIDKVVFFLHYVSAGLFISYYLLPKYFYTKKYVALSVALLVLCGVVYFLEEFVFEKIFFPGERGQHVSNVFLTLVNILPLIFMIVAFKLAWDASVKQREVNELKDLIKESELQFLKSQINPHFLFNNLNNLYSYALDNSPKTPSIILELSSVLRYMLYDCKENFVPLAKEIKHLKNFTALNELQIEDRGSVRFETENLGGNYTIAPLILMVFIENAFKHSTASQSDAIAIHIAVRIKNDTLYFECHNSYLENTNTQSLAHGIGLANVQKRLELLYPKKHDLKIEQSDAKFKVVLTIKLT
jgi:sensor histidine kinase YesM